MSIASDSAPDRGAVDDTAPPLSRVAYEGIRDRIIDGRLPEGIRLRERDLAEILGVSRVPVREAIPQLESAGFLISLGRRGLVVPPVSEAQAEDLYDIRAALESLAARRAAQRATSEGVARLRRAVADAEAELERDDLVAFTHANGRIHDVIEQIAGNTMLDDMMALVRERNLRLNRVGLHDAPHDRHREHLGIVEAIADGNAELAAALALVHVEHVRRRTVGTMHTTTAPTTTAHEGDLG